MNKLQKLLWASFSAIICLIYKDAFGLACSYVITSSKYLGKTVGTTVVNGITVANIDMATCSAAGICSLMPGGGYFDDAPNCGGKWFRYEDLAPAYNRAAATTVTYRTMCAKNRYVEGAVCTLEGCVVTCTSCPSSGATQNVSSHILVGGNEWFPGPRYVCGQRNLQTGAALSGVYMMEVAIQCDFQPFDYYNYITSCYLESGTHTDTTGTYNTPTSCPYTM